MSKKVVAILSNIGATFRVHILMHIGNVLVKRKLIPLLSSFSSRFIAAYSFGLFLYIQCKKLGLQNKVKK